MILRQAEIPKGGVRLYDGNTDETIDVISRFHWFDDFVGYNLDQQVSTTGSGRWRKGIVGAAPPTLTLTDDALGSSGAATFTLTSTSEAQRAVLTFGDLASGTATDATHCLDISNTSAIEYRFRISTVLTGNSELLLGLASDDNATANSITNSAWLRVVSSNVATVEIDDGSTDTPSSGNATISAAAWHVFRAEFYDVNKIRFFLNGSEPWNATTFAGAAFTGNAAIMQPYMALQKSGGTGVGTVLVDSVRFWSVERSS